MALVKSGLFTEFRGKVAQTEFRMRKNKKIELSKKRVPRNPRSEKQQRVRKAYGKCVEEWKKLSPEEKHEYQARASKYKLDGYRLFMKECLKSLLGVIWYEIVIDNSANANDLTDYQILLEIINDSQFFEDCKGNRVYLEFYDEDKTTLLNHFVELWDTANNNAKIWIKVPQIPANAVKNIYLLINPSRTEDLSNPYNVFDHYEDFEDQNLSDFRGATGQLEIASDAPAEGNYYLKVNGNHVDNQWVQDLPKTFGRGIIIEGYAKHIEEAGSIRWGIFESWNEDVNSSAQGYWIAYVAGTGEVILGEPDWDIPTRVSATGESGYNVWRKFKLIIKEGQVVLEFAGVTLTLDSTTFSSFPMWGGYTYRTAGYDCIRIRKFTEPEPSVSYAKI